MTLTRYLKGWKSNLYYATMPWCNYVINPLWHRRFTRAFIPKTLYIETTNYCNAKCVMCPHEKMTRPLSHMPWELFTKIIDECATFEGRGLQVFLHKDGEPLMDPRLFDRIRYAKARLPRSLMHFNTNAALLTAERADAILQSPLDSMVVSLDGASRETYEQIRVGLRYEVVQANVDAFLEKKRACGSRLKVIMQMVVGRGNEGERRRYRELWEGKADRIIFKPMHNFLVQGTALAGGDVGSEQLTRCSMPFHVMLFYSNGDVGLCCWDYDQIMELGNVRSHTILEVYNNEQYAAVRNAMATKACGHLHPCDACSQIYGHDGVMWRPSLDVDGTW